MVRDKILLIYEWILIELFHNELAVSIGAVVLKLLIFFLLGGDFRIFVSGLSFVIIAQMTSNIIDKMIVMCVPNVKKEDFCFYKKKLKQKRVRNSKLCQQMIKLTK